MKFNTPYTTHNDPISFETEPSQTDQQYKESCDINFIVNQYVKQGIPIPQQPVQYADLTNVEDYDQAVLTVANYKTAFETLSSKDRERFHGDVREYLQFITKNENLKESIQKNYIDSSSVSEEVLSALFSKTDINNPVGELNPVKPQETASKSTNENIAS